MKLINIDQLSSKEVPLSRKTEVMIHRLPITKARINLGEVAKRVHVHKEYFILEKDGIPVVGIMDAEELEDYLETRDPKIRSLIRKSNEDIRAGRIRPAEALLAEFRTERSRNTARRRRRT